MKPNSENCVSPFTYLLTMKSTIATLLTILCSSLLLANPKSSRSEYIAEYSAIAVAQMRTYKIPASITLAQGILESGSGNSFLARASKNHFGIKCGSQWNGKTSFHDDDEKNECFRAYSDVTDSYLDHSKFLTKNRRYAFLFELDPNDYKAWAKGLSKAGYATNPHYAQKLIQLIEEEDLYTYDRNKGSKAKTDASLAFQPNKYTSINKSSVRYVKKGETFYSISIRTGLTLRQLHKYNDALGEMEYLEVGTPIFLEAKKRHAGSNKILVLDRNTSLAEISQEKGIKMKSLMKLNQISTPHQTMQKGTKIFLR